MLFLKYVYSPLGDPVDANDLMYGTYIPHICPWNMWHTREMWWAYFLWLTHNTPFYKRSWKKGNIFKWTSLNGCNGLEIRQRCTISYRCMNSCNGLERRQIVTGWTVLVYNTVHHFIKGLERRELHWKLLISRHLYQYPDVLTDIWSAEFISIEVVQYFDTLSNIWRIRPISGHELISRYHDRSLQRIRVLY